MYTFDINALVIVFFVFLQISCWLAKQNLL
jgi:hypothetical protein